MWPSLTTPTENTSKGGKGPISLSSLVHIWFSSFLQQPKQNCFSFQTTIAISEMSVIWGNLQDTCWQCISKSPWVPLDHFCEVIRFLTIQFHPEFFLTTLLSLYISGLMLKNCMTILSYFSFQELFLHSFFNIRVLIISLTLKIMWNIKKMSSAPFSGAKEEFWH